MEKSKMEEPKPRLTLAKVKESLKLFAYVHPYRWHFYAGIVLLALSSGVFFVFPYSIGLAMDVAEGTSEVNVTLSQIGMGLVVVLLLQSVISYFRVTTFAVVSERGTADLRRSIYERIIQLPIVFFEKNRVGDLVSRINNDVDKLYNVFSFVLAEFLRQIILLIGCTIFMVYSSFKLFAVMFLTFPVIVIGAMFFGRMVRKLSKERQESLAQTNTILDETLQSIHIVKAFANEAFESARYGRGNDRIVDISMKFAGRRALFAAFIISMLFGALFFVIMQAMYMVQTKELRAGEVVQFATLTALMGGAIAGLGNFYTELVSAIGATERIREILESPTETDSIVRKNIPAGRFGGKISFKDVEFSYPTRTDVPVLKGVSMEIAPGEKVAIAGQSGAGKSTIMQLLLQLHAPLAGKIEVDGRSQYDYDLKSYRHNFGIVPQEVILFGGTIRENIIYGNPNASEEVLKQAAIQANALEFIERFPEGFETIVGDRGIKLSGGQRQRIAIARAILHDPAILLLDEATSSLDAESEKLVQEALDRLMVGRTSIIIAHRLSTIRDVDRIYVLDKGQIVETGTHAELVEKPKGLYASLARLQFQE
jgi:ATP-binding cassette, subfamily B, bacterial